MLTSLFFIFSSTDYNSPKNHKAAATAQNMLDLHFSAIHYCRTNPHYCDQDVVLYPQRYMLDSFRDNNVVTFIYNGSLYTVLNSKERTKKLVIEQLIRKLKDKNTLILNTEADVCSRVDCFCDVYLKSPL